MVTSTLSLSHFLADMAESGLCFCCDSPTDLGFDADGRLLIRCPRCGAEVSAEDTVHGVARERVLQAA